MSKKDRKERTVYVDDGRTLADMSGVTSGFHLNNRNPARPRPRAKEVWSTYWNAVRMMFLPMLAVMGGIVVIYIILTFIFAYLA